MTNLTTTFPCRRPDGYPSGRQLVTTAVGICSRCSKPAICADRSAEWTHGRVITDRLELANIPTAAADVDIPRYFLRGFDEPVQTVYSTLFGALAQLAAPHLKHFWGDLYSDAKWIEENVHGPICFFFGADDTGTAIGTDSSLIRQARTNVWQIQLIEDNHAWYAAVALRYVR